MKFAKQLESEAEDIPSEWRPYLIQYKTLKKVITKVAEEIESRGLSTSLLHECLDEDMPHSNDTSTEDIPKIKYYFTGEAPHIKPNIEFTYNPKEPKIQKLLSKLIQQQQDIEKPALEYKHSHNNKDFFTLSSQDNIAPETALRRRRSSAETLVKELLNLTLKERDKQLDTEDTTEQETTKDIDKPELKTLVIELEQDDEFFRLLLKELEQAANLQSVTEQKFQNDISDLETRMTKVASPHQKTDMYNWRKIFSIYMDAQIFRGNSEQDRHFRSVERAKKQMAWFLNTLNKENILSKLKTKESKHLFENFIALNTEIITIKHYQVLNETAMRKILKKHDKRSGLTASQCFPEVIQQQHVLSPALASLLYATITSKLTTIVPQPDDYACPVCMSVAWRPIRLACNHVFCVRCLIKAQKKKMSSCPLCRHPTAVETATALNLDEGLQNFLKLYFPKEIKDKKRENEREQAIEDVQAMTGRRYTEEQLMRMSQQSDNKCLIM